MQERILTRNTPGMRLTGHPSPSLCSDRSMARDRSAVLHFAAFLLLCMLSAIAALRADLFPNLSTPLPAIEKQALTLGLLAVAAIAILAFRRTSIPNQSHNVTAIWIAVGFALFTLPALLSFFAERMASGSPSPVLFTLVPVFAIVLQPHLAENASQPRSLALPAALVSLYGSLQTFPFALPNSVTGALALLAGVLSAFILATGLCLVARAATTGQQQSLFWGTAVATGSAAFSLMILGAILQPSALHGIVPATLLTEALWSALIAAPAFALLFWLLPRLSPIQLSTRISLSLATATLFEMLSFGAAGLLKSPAGLGLLLMAAGAIYLLFPHRTAPQEIHLIPDTESE